MISFGSFIVLMNCTVSKAKANLCHMGDPGDPEITKNVATARFGAHLNCISEIAFHIQVVGNTIRLDLCLGFIQLWSGF